MLFPAFAAQQVTFEQYEMEVKDDLVLKSFSSIPAYLPGSFLHLGAVKLGLQQLDLDQYLSAAGVTRVQRAIRSIREVHEFENKTADRLAEYKMYVLEAQRTRAVLYCKEAPIDAAFRYLKIVDLPGRPNFSSERRRFRKRREPKMQDKSVRG